MNEKNTMNKKEKKKREHKQETRRISRRVRKEGETLSREGE